MVMRFLKQRSTGKIFVRTDRLAERSDMVPHVWKDAQAAISFQGDEESSSRVDSSVLQDPESTMDMEEASQLVREWFDKDISKVNKPMLESFALQRFNIDLDMRQTKLNMIRDIKELFNTQGKDIEKFLAEKREQLTIMDDRKDFEAYARDNFGLEFGQDDLKPDMIDKVMALEEKRFLGE